MKTPNLKKAIYAAILLMISIGVSPFGSQVSVSAQTSSSNGMKKLALPLQQVVNGQVTTENSWYKLNTNTPFVQALVLTNIADTSSARKAVTDAGGTVWSRFYSVDGFVAWIPAAKLLEVANRSDIERITPNFVAQKSTSLLEMVTGVLNTRSLNTTTNQFSGVDGTGVGIAVLDSGIMSANAGFKDASGNSRIKAQVDTIRQNTFINAIKDTRFVDTSAFRGRDLSSIYYNGLTAPGVSFNLKNLLPNADLFGHGTFVAGVAAGRGNGSGTNTDVTGIAPNANLISIKVLDNEGIGQVSDVIKGIDWAILHKDEYNIRVMNLSLGGSSSETYLNDPLCRAVRKAYSEGIVVIVAAGNYGKDAFGNPLYGTIMSPGNDPTVITVGAANTFQTANRTDDRITSFSSKGPTRSYYLDSTGAKIYDNLIKPDLVAPGNKIVSMESINNFLVSTNPILNIIDPNSASPVMQMSGTSVSAPVVSGAAALMLQKNPSLTPALVKAILQYTAQNVPNANLAEQGAGLLNISGAIRLSDAIRPGRKPKDLKWNS